ncbi:ABC transporter ATP-binding protein [Candidatus Kaiserbacteria bacterium]|nr:ABC transporter ATP-binding protein [Candidatus Kaiserbacteria bacterium]
MQKEILLKLENASVHYGGVLALDNATIQIDEGEIVALMGPNGAGKSTIIKSIFGLASPSRGRVEWHETEVVPIPHEMVQRGISYVPQGRQVFTRLSVKENLEIGGYIIHNKKERNRRIEEVLDIFPDLKTKLNASAKTLSGGQQQMLVLARGLMTDPKVLLLDEPTLGLSPKLVKQVFAKIKEINERRKTTILVVEHNLKTLLEIAHRAYVLVRGEIVARGTGRDIEKSGILKKVFTE